MANKAAPEAAAFFKFDVVKSCLEVNQGYILMTPQEASVAAGLIELVLVLLSSLVDRYDILYHPVWLTRLALGHE